MPGEAAAMMLIDGRNRRSACKLAGVVPQTRGVTGDDLKAFVISANIRRRHMTKGQQAMAVAMIYPEPEDRGRGKKGSVAERFPEISKGKVSEARFVLSHAPGLASLVLSGSVKLDAAYTTAKSRRDASSLQEPLLADLGALYRGAAAGPGAVQALEVEQASGEMILEDGEGFGGTGHGGESGPIRSFCHPP